MPVPDCAEQETLTVPTHEDAVRLVLSAEGSEQFVMPDTSIDPSLRLPWQEKILHGHAWHFQNIHGKCMDLCGNP